MRANIIQSAKKMMKYGPALAAGLVLMLPRAVCAESTTGTAGASGNIITVAGTGTSGYSGTGGPAAAADLNLPVDAAVDSSGNLYIADTANLRIRKVAPSGIITTVGGNGTPPILIVRRGVPATSAGMIPGGLTIDSSGNIYFADTAISRIRRISASGIITTVAGKGTAGYSGDGGAATAAMLKNPSAVVADGSGNLYISDSLNHRIRRVDAAGIITTVAGNGTPGYSGDGGAATAASLNTPADVAVDSSGNIYIADTLNYRIRKVDPSGVISTVAGNGSSLYSGDGGPATGAGLTSFGLTVDSSGNLYFADKNNQRIRKIDASGSISTVAGNGSFGYSGDWGAATAATLGSPTSVTLDGSGNLFIADTNNSAIRKVSMTGLLMPDFSAAPVLGPPPLVVQFTATVGASSGFTWDFGDGGTGTGANPQHTYQSAGVYDVSLSLAGADGATLTKTKAGYIKVIANAPVAAFTASVTDGPAPLAVTFTDTSTGDITGRAWEFGDGGTDNGTSGKPKHTYASAGQYTVILKVTGDAGASKATQIITAEPGNRTSAISGRITGAIQAGIDISLSGTDLNMTVQTAADGSYSFAGVPNGSYRITPIRAGYVFDPPGAEKRVAGTDVTNVDFAASSAGPSVSQPAVSPARVAADNTMQVTLTAVISDPAAISLVTADLSAIGGSAMAQLRDDGAGGDATAGDGVYTLITTVDNATEPGLKALSVTAVDNDAMANTAFVGLDVYRQYHGSIDQGGTNDYTVQNDLDGQTLLFTLTQTGGGSSSPARWSGMASADCSPTVVVISPGGGKTSGQTSGANQTTVEVADAAAGQWTCQVGNPCGTTISYGLESSIAGSGLVTGLVVDSRTGVGIGGVLLQTTGGIGAQTDSGVYVMTHPSGVYSLNTSMAGFLPAVRSLTVNAGGSTEMDIALDNGTASGGCFLTSTLGEGRRLERLRRFRDGVLGATAQGRRYVELYYRYSPEIVALMKRDRELAGQMYGCIGELFPLVEKMLSGRDAVPDARQRRLLQGVLEKLRERARPQLRAEIGFLVNSLQKHNSLKGLLQ